MGNFYTNYTLRGPSQESVATLLAGRSSIVTRSENGCVVVFDEQSDEQNQEVIAEVASVLSGELRCPLLAVLNHDDDIFWYQLYLNGALVDEYNSTPNYFEDSEEEDPTPTGGDAEALCTAFGVATMAVVEPILRKAGFHEDGYTFAVERHSDLADALGIPAFGVGAGFLQFSGGEFPEGLRESDLVRTKDLFATPTNSLPIPGYYKVRCRAKNSTAWLDQTIPSAWMPQLWADLDCSERDLPPAFHQTTALYREQFKKLGFVELGFRKLDRVLNPSVRQQGGIIFVDRSRCHFGQLLCIRYYSQASKTEVDRIVIAFTAIWENSNLSCSNETQSPFDDLPNHPVVRIQSNDVAFVYAHFLENLKQHAEPPRHFPDVASLQTWFDANAVKVLVHRVREGWFVRMTDFEVAVARRKLPPPLSKP